MKSSLQTPHGTSPMEFGRRSLVERQQVFTWADIHWFKAVGEVIRRKKYDSTFSLQESVEALINCVNENIGFSDGKPVAAITIYKCLLHWRTFEADKTNVYDRLIQIFASGMQVFLASVPSLNQFFSLFWFYDLHHGVILSGLFNSCCPLKNLHNLYHRNKTAMPILHTGYQTHRHYWLYYKRVWNLLAQL